jgi:hypothetical protein
MQESQLVWHTYYKILAIFPKKMAKISLISQFLPLMFQNSITLALNLIIYLRNKQPAGSTCALKKP